MNGRVTRSQNTAPSARLHRPQTRSFRDLVMQISNILQQLAMPKRINRRPNCAFEPLF